MQYTVFAANTPKVFLSQCDKKLENSILLCKIQPAFSFWAVAKHFLHCLLLQPTFVNCDLLVHPLGIIHLYRGCHLIHVGRFSGYVKFFFGFPFLSLLDKMKTARVQRYGSVWHLTWWAVTPKWLEFVWASFLNHYESSHPEGKLPLKSWVIIDGRFLFFGTRLEIESRTTSVWGTERYFQFVSF